MNKRVETKKARMTVQDEDPTARELGEGRERKDEGVTERMTGGRTTVQEPWEE